MIPAKVVVFRFSDIEVHEHELKATRAGEALNLEPKAFRVLVYLIKHTGHLVTKSELIDAVWGETAVTDNSLTRAIASLRRVLEDDPRQPRFIETVSTAGYRFICPVESVESSNGSHQTLKAATLPEAADGVLDANMPVSGPGSKKKAGRSFIHRWRWVLMVASPVVVISVAVFLWYASRPFPSPHISDIARITNDPRYDKFVAGTDGTRIYLGLSPGGPGQVSVSGGEITTIPISIPNNQVPGWTLGPVSPDGLSFLVWGRQDDNYVRDLWAVATSGGPAHLIARALDAAWSADGKQVIYSTSSGSKLQIYAVASAGGTPHLIRTLDGPASNFACSPDGSRIRFILDWHKIMEMASDGSNLHEIQADWHPSDLKCCGIWAPDGNFFLFYSAASSEAESIPAYQMWALDERHGWLHKPTAKPVQLTFGPMTWSPEAFSRDGRKIFAMGDALRGELVRYNRQNGQIEPFLGGISAEMVDFSRDGKFILYVPFPGDTLLRANRDGTGVQQVLSATSHPANPRWSPDNNQIAFTSGPFDAHFIYVVSAQGGIPVRVLPDNECCDESDPTWSPDGKQLAVWVESPKVKTETELRIADLSSHQVRYLPRPPKRTWSPRWSPDGRYIVCPTNPNPNTDGLEIFDFKTQTWKVLLTDLGSGNWPSWSHDSRWIYYVRQSGRQGSEFSIFRISVDGAKPELVTNLPGFHGTGWYYNWFGLDPDDNPLMLRNAGDSEIYALTLERK